jgi:phosphomannomutase
MKNGKNRNILIVTDDRPSKDPLLKYCSQIFAYDGFTIYHQKDRENHSRLSSPYGAASVELLENINLVIILTASHNDLSWNGIKFYIDYPIPMSGDLFKEISTRALKYKEIQLKSNFDPIKVDAEQSNNDYVINLISRIIDIEALQNRKIIIWPYLGKARGIVNLFKRLGADVTLIDEELDPPNPIKSLKEEKLQKVMQEIQCNVALLLDADRDRIALYVKQDGEFKLYIPNEIYSAMHNILGEKYNKKILNVRTIPSDLRGDHTSFVNILTGVGYKHLGIILYFLLGIEVDQSKIDSAILYMEKNDSLEKIDKPEPLKEYIIELMKRQKLDKETFLLVMWEESGGHTLTLIDIRKTEKDEYKFSTDLPIIADKYPVPALVLITELLYRGFKIPEAIDWSIKGINQTISATDKQKVKLMKDFLENDGKTIDIGDKRYNIKALSDNNEEIEIYQLKSNKSTLYFRPSGTGMEVRFYIFADRDVYQEEIEEVQEFVKKNYL